VLFHMPVPTAAIAGRPGRRQFTTVAALPALHSTPLLTHAVALQGGQATVTTTADAKADDDSTASANPFVDVLAAKVGGAGGTG